MPSSPIMRFMGEGGQQVYWGRADVDGAPFRGPMSPMLTNEEAEERLVRVGDSRQQLFDLSDPEQAKKYAEVCERIVNGWYQPMHRQHLPVKIRRVRRDPTTGERTVTYDVIMKVYIEWVEVYMQDGRPMLSQRPYLGRPNDE